MIKNLLLIFSTGMIAAGSFVAGKTDSQNNFTPLDPPIIQVGEQPDRKGGQPAEEGVQNRLPQTDDTGNRVALDQKAEVRAQKKSLQTVVADEAASQVALDRVPPDRVPFTLFHDFGTGEKFGWEPYPYQQDTGYDALFFTQKAPARKNSQYALARPVKANDTVELYQGFTRRLNMWTTPATRVQLAVYLQSDREPETLELSLGTFAGERYMHTIREPRANEWLELDIPIGAFRLEDGRSLAAGEHLQVVTFKATYPIVYYLYTYTILMDEFRINGERQRRFRAIDPGSTDFEKFGVSALNRHYYHGDVISLKVASERGAPLSRVRGILVDGDGQVVRDNIEFSRGPGEWVNDSIHRVSESDAPGRWELRLTGRTGDGGEVRWGFQFLVPGEPISGFPRLFFTSGELAERLENGQSPVAGNILQSAMENSRSLLEKADPDDYKEETGELYRRRAGEALTGGPYSGWRDRFDAWLSPMYSLGDIIREGSFLYAFSGDRSAGEKAKEALLKLSSFEHWNHPWKIENRMHIYLYVGRVVSTVAYGYDMLYELLDEREKAFVRDALMEKGIKPFHRDMVEMNRMPSHNTNHIARIVSGIGQAATVLYGEDPGNPYMEPYMSGILVKFHAYLENNHGPGGGTGEPFIYQSAATAYSAELLAVLERNFGIDWSATTDVGSYYLYPLYATHPDGKYADFGDGGRVYDRFTNLAAQWFVHRLGNPFLYRYVKPWWEEGNGGYLGYLWYRDDIEPAARDSLDPYLLVEKNGVQLMRSGWEDESTVVSFKAGPHGNHFHYDQGTFRIMTNGTELLTDPLIPAGGYYTNLEFAVYNIHAISKNVMLVDHDPESQAPAHYDNGIAALRDWPQITHSFGGSVADAVDADLASVYKAKLDHYSRTLLHTGDGPLFLFDRVESTSGDGHVYNWLFHAPQNEGGERSIRYEETAGRVTIDRPGARLTMDVLSPRIESARIRDNNDVRYPESFVSLNSQAGLSEAHFLATILPEARPPEGDYGPRPVSERIDAPGWTGARVEHAGREYYGIFRTGEDPVARSLAGFATDAHRFTATVDEQGTLSRVYFEGSSFEGRGMSASSDVRLTCAIELKDAAGHPGESAFMQIEAKTGEPAHLAISGVQRSSQVLLNGEATGNWSYDPETLELTILIPEGRHDFSVR